MKYYLIAGEASGDLHGSNLIKALHHIDPQAQIRCWGGDLMQSAGAELVKHYRHTAYMGFAEVIKHLPAIWRNLRFCRQDLAAFQPDALILIDYPGFNLRIAPFAKQQKYRAFYYISPQVWAWKARRVEQMQRNIEKLYAILPFEVDFYRQHGWHEVEFMGHPLLDAIHAPAAISDKPDYYSATEPIVALLPGSRTQEIRRMLPVMLAATNLVGNAYHYVVAGAPALPPEFYTPFLRTYPHVHLVMNQTYDVLRRATAALVTSGTATLETALIGVPQVVCYRGSPISYYIAKQLVKVHYISLVNLILNEPAVTELIQHQFTPKNTADALCQILPTGKHRTDILLKYDQLRQQLGGAGASMRTAQDIYRLLQPNQPK